MTPTNEQREKAHKAVSDYSQMTGLSGLNPKKQRATVEAFYDALPTIFEALSPRPGTDGLDASIAKVQGLADDIDLEGLDREGLHIHLNHVCEAARAYVAAPNVEDGAIHKYMGKPYSRRMLEEENANLRKAALPEFPSGWRLSWICPDDGQFKCAVVKIDKFGMCLDTCAANGLSPDAAYRAAFEAVISKIKAQ